MHEHEAFRAFEQGEVNAGDELWDLGERSARAWLIFLASILNRQRDHKKDQEFFECDGVSFYHGSAKKMFLFYSVEQEQDGSMYATVIMAGRYRSQESNEGRYGWVYAEAAAEAKRRILEYRR